LLKAEFEASGLIVLCIHPTYSDVPFFLANVGVTAFKFNQYYDHDVIEGYLENV